MDAGQVPLEFDSGIVRVARDLEELGQRQLAIAVENGYLLDFRQGLSAQCRGKDPFDFDRHGRVGMIC